MAKCFRLMAGPRAPRLEDPPLKRRRIRKKGKERKNKNEKEQEQERKNKKEKDRKKERNREIDRTIDSRGNRQLKHEGRPHHSGYFGPLIKHKYLSPT